VGVSSAKDFSLFPLGAWGNSPNTSKQRERPSIPFGREEKNIGVSSRKPQGLVVA